MEPSPELEALALRRAEAFNSRDNDTVLDMYAEEPGLIVIGSDSDEWWSGYETIRSVVTTLTPELASVDARVDVEHVEAFSEGTVGWFVGRLVARSETTTVPMRYTAVLHLDRGVWRIVHAHLSQGVDSEVSFGVQVSKVEQLAAAVRVEQPDLRDTADEDGRVTIAFSDLESSTELAVSLGDHRWLELLRWYDRVVVECTTTEGGRVVKSLGDGHMLVFPSASRALSGSVSIMRSLREGREGEDLRLRVGLHTGEVLRHSDDFFGQAVITAARVAAAANGNEILVSSVVHELTRRLGAFRFGKARVAQLKGFPGEYELFPVIWN
jgi:class 3 adenylate cyclase